MHSFYELSRTSYLCDLRSAFILLDAARGEYFRIAGSQYAWLREILASGQSVSAEAEAFAFHLVRLGILTPETSGKPAAEPLRPTRALSCIPPASPKARWFDSVRVAKAHFSAARMMQDGRFPEIIEEATRWKQDVDPSTANVPEKLDRARIFERLSPIFRSRHDACFERSLALLRFLTQDGFRADWVFGVRDEPFLAHCWIEADGYVLNDEVAHTSGYIPILTV